jgi:gluconokinase
MMADIFNQEVIVPESYESSCLGAVILGLYALGEVDDLTIVSEMVGSTYSHKPDEEHAEVYRELLPVYIRLSRLFQSEYASIADYQRRHLE